MHKWNENELINKARHGNVWNDLLERGTIREHWPSSDVVGQVLRRLRSEGNEEASKRIGEFQAPERSDLQDFTNYDE